MHRYKEWNLSQLRSFCECVGQKSYAAAARALRLSQPTVWLQIKSLERAWKVTLLERRGRELRLTEDGRAFWELAHGVLDAADSLREQVKEAGTEGVRSLTVVATPGLLAEEFAEPIVAFCRDHPQVRLTLLTRQGPGALDALSLGDADLGIVPESYSFTNRRLFHYEEIARRRTALDIPAGHPLARRRRFTPADLVKYPLILPEAENHPWHQRILQIFREAGVHDKLRVLLYVGNNIPARKYVSLGLGVSLSPQADNGIRFPNVVTRFLGPDFPHMPLLLLWRRGGVPRKQAQQFADYLRERRK